MIILIGVFAIDPAHVVTPGLLVVNIRHSFSLLLFQIPKP